MQEQWDRLSRAVGNVFYPILQKILPYINGVLMALTEIFNLLASLLGFEMPEFDYSGLSVTSDAALDLMDNLDGAGESADKLASKMKGLRGFDKLNVINTPSKGGGGSSASGGGSFVDPKIMDAFNKTFEQYNDLMDSVRMKALDIRDAIMEWLGFTKKINPLTGEISWEYEGIQKTLTNMWDSFMKLNPLAKAFVGYGIWKVFKNIWTWGGKVLNILGIGGVFTSFKNLLSVGGEATSRVDKFKRLRFETTLQNIGDKLKLIGVGAAGTIASFVGMQSSMKSIIYDGENFGNVLGTIASGLGSVASGAMIGTAILPGWGTVIGAAAGGIISLVAALTSASERTDGWNEVIDANAEKLDKFSDSLKKQYEEIENQASFDMTKNTLASKLVAQLEEITDANGKVKEGYEEKANFIINELNKAYGTEIKMVDGVIDKYQEQISALKETIKKEKDEIYLQMAKEKYAVAIKNRAEAEYQLNEAISLRKGILDDESLSEEERIKKLAKADKQIQEANKNIEMNQQAVANYEGLTTAIIENNTDAIEKYEKKVAQTYSDITTDLSDSYVAQARISANYWETNLREMNKNYEELTDAEKIFVDEQLNSFISMFQNGVKEVGQISPEMVDAWRNMSEQSENAFMTALEKLPADMRQQVIDKMYSQGYTMSTELQAGINAKFPNITIKPEMVQPTQNEINNFANKLSSKLSYAGIGLGVLGSLKADGGIFVNGKWQDVAQYASGTVNAPVGQMFVARERGPELVGTIGGHTAVMNNDQIVSSVASGVYQAVRSATSQQTSRQPQVFNIYLDKNNKIATYMLDKFDDMAKSNGKPIEIGG